MIRPRKGAWPLGTVINNISSSPRNYLIYASFMCISPLGKDVENQHSFQNLSS